MTSGSGSGDGDGYGYGSGSGYGSGDGYGYGSGSGSGSGSGDGKLLPAELAALAMKLGPIPPGATLAIWKSDAKGYPCNNGSWPEPARRGLRQKVPGPLELCGRGALHATLKPNYWCGSRMWLVALYGEVIGDGEKLGALEREILGEVIA